MSICDNLRPLKGEMLEALDETEQKNKEIVLIFSSDFKIIEKCIGNRCSFKHKFIKTYSQAAGTFHTHPRGDSDFSRRDLIWMFMHPRFKFNCVASVESNKIICSETNFDVEYDDLEKAYTQNEHYWFRFHNNTLTPEEHEKRADMFSQYLSLRHRIQNFMRRQNVCEI